MNIEHQEGRDAIQPSGREEEVVRRIVNRYFEMVGTGEDPESIASLFSENVDWNIPGHTALVPWIGRRTGRCGVAQFFYDLREQVEPVRFDLHSIVVEKDRAVALGELASRVRDTGRVIESEFAIEFTVRDALIIRYRLYEDSFAVAQAVGQATNPSPVPERLSPAISPSSDPVFSSTKP